MNLRNGFLKLKDFPVWKMIQTKPMMDFVMFFGKLPKENDVDGMHKQENLLFGCSF